jgi:hypothetical protein
MTSTSLFVVTLCAISAISGAIMVGLSLKLSRNWTNNQLKNRVKKLKRTDYFEGNDGP